ncbi:hypothetical protein L7F22_037991 [Adiantum nelumboides]|nr:hypothetical protein [Adiantum nelumboides]
MQILRPPGQPQPQHPPPHIAPIPPLPIPKNRAVNVISLDAKVKAKEEERANSFPKDKGKAKVEDVDAMPIKRARQEEVGMSEIGERRKSNENEKSGSKKKSKPTRKITIKDFAFGQWESQGGGESSGWGASTWDQLGNDGNGYSEEFENVMRWDDSGALDALETSKRFSEERSKGVAYSVSLPSPDLYIQAVDWDGHEDLELPDPGVAFSPSRKGQRKRGRRSSGGFGRSFDRQEISHDWKQRSEPFSQMGYRTEVYADTERERTYNLGPSMLQGNLDSLPRTAAPPELQLPIHDQSRSNWSSRWTSTHQKQSSNWHGYGRSHWDGPQNMQFHSSQQRWRTTNPQPEQARGWSQRGGLHHLSSNEPRVVTPTGRANDRVNRQESSMQSFTHQPPLIHFSSGSRQQHAPSQGPETSRKWRPQQQPNHRWQ